MVLVAEIALLYMTIKVLMNGPLGTFCSSVISTFGIFLYFDWLLCESILINTVLTSMERLLEFTEQKRDEDEGIAERGEDIRTTTKINDNDVENIIDIEHLTWKLEQ